MTSYETRFEKNKMKLVTGQRAPHQVFVKLDRENEADEISVSYADVTPSVWIGPEHAEVILGGERGTQLTTRSYEIREWKRKADLFDKLKDVLDALKEVRL